MLIILTKGRDNPLNSPLCLYYESLHPHTLISFPPLRIFTSPLRYESMPPSVSLRLPLCFCRVSSLSLCSTHLFNSFMRVNNLPLYIPPIYSPLWHHHTRYESMYPQPHSLSDMRVCSLPVSLPSTNLVASTMRVCSLPLCAPTHHYKSIYRPSRQSHHWIVSDCGLQPPSDKDFCKNIIIITHNSHQIIWSNTVYS